MDFQAKRVLDLTHGCHHFFAATSPDSWSLVEQPRGLLIDRWEIFRRHVTGEESSNFCLLGSWGYWWDCIRMVYNTRRLGLNPYNYCDISVSDMFSTNSLEIGYSTWCNPCLTWPLPPCKEPCPWFRCPKNGHKKIIRKHHVPGFFCMFIRISWDLRRFNDGVSLRGPGSTATRSLAVFGRQLGLKALRYAAMWVNTRPGLYMTKKLWKDPPFLIGKSSINGL